MSTIKKAPELVRANGSHWLELERTSAGEREPFSKEELYPILELEVSRVGLVRASFEVSRYVASSWDEETGTSSPVWTEWRVFLRDVRTQDAERPDVPHLGREAAGIGPATRKAIGDACEPIIREWLDSDDYRASRQRAARAAVVRTLDAPSSYQLDNARQALARARVHLDDQHAGELLAVLEMLATAAAELDSWKA